MTGLPTTVSCFDRLFDRASSNKYFLSIRLEPDGLFFTIYDPEELKYLAFESYILSGLTEVYSFIQKHEILNLTFAKTICVVPSRKYTLVPSQLFIADKAEEYFKFSHTLKISEEIRIAQVYDTDATMIYSIDVFWLETIKDHFPNALILPATITFTDYVLPRVRNSRDSLMFVNLYEDNFDLIIVTEGKLVFCNNFTYKTAVDIAYYAVFVIDQLKINVEKAELKLSGRVNSMQDTLKLLRKYIKSVAYLDIENDLRKSYALNDINSYNYPDLFNPRLCEL